MNNRYPERIIPEDTSAGPLAAHRKRYDFAKQFCAEKIVLDAACGVGYGSYCLGDVAKEIIGVDMSKEAVIYAKEHYQRENIQFKVTDVHNLEFADKYFDVVCSFETLEHLRDPKRFIAEVSRVLKDNGQFIVSIPHVKRTRHKPENPYHKIEYSYKDFEALLGKYFGKVEIYGQRRVQSALHYYLQQLDILSLRSRLPVFFRRKASHAVRTKSWDEAGLDEFTIDDQKLYRAMELIGVCQIR